MRYLTPLIVAITCTLSACGGGGGGGSGSGPSPSGPAPTPSAPPPPPSTNTAPTFTTTSFSVNEDTDLSGTITATDAQNDAITFALVTNPSNGIVSNFTVSGGFTYRSSANFSGTDTFTVRATDSAGAAVTATVTITVAPGDDAPTIRDDVITASGSNPLVDVLANDSEPDGEALSLSLVGEPDFGTASVEEGRIRLTLPAGFQGFNTFTYRAVDSAGEGTSARAVVFIDSAPVRFIYVTNEEGEYARNIYVDDLLTRRRVTSFSGDEETDLGGWVFVSDNGRTILYDERATSGAGGRKFWTAAAANGSSAPRRVNPPLSTGESIEAASYPSPDGRWAVYRIRDANFIDRYYLADLTSGDAPRELLPPAGAIGIDATDISIMFDGQSQYAFVPVRVQTVGGQGTTIYRVPVTDPAAMQLFFSPAVANQGTYISYVNADGSRAVVIAYGPNETHLYLSRAADPTNPVPLTPGVGPDFMMGSYRVDWERDRLIFNIDTVPGTTPYSSTIHVTDLASGNWIELGNLPADFTRPEFIDAHPSDNTVLFRTTVNDPVNGIADEVREVDLVAGAPTRLLEGSNFGLTVPGYTNEGASVLLARQGAVESFPRHDPANRKTLFTDAFATNYRFSDDGKIISVSAAPWSDTFADDSIWAVNQTTAPGTFAKRLVHVTNQSNAYVSVGTVAPRY